jgi:hypothetical protein
LAKVSQPCWAFQATLGAKMASAITAASHGQGVRSCRRPSADSASHSTMPGARNNAEYFDRQSSPAIAPAASHQAPWPPRTARTAQQSAAVQKKALGASGTASSPATPISTVALSQTPARAAVRSARPSVRARS